jgi:hypothetical protein
MKKFIFPSVIIVFVTINTPIFGQNPQLNHQKYWNYKNRPNEKVEIWVHDLSGKLILQLEQNSTSVYTQLNELSSGMYIVSKIVGSAVYRKKIIVQK